MALMWHAQFKNYVLEQINLCRKRNPRFSQRAFAKKVGLSTGAISELMNNRLKISEQRALKILEVLPETQASRELKNAIRLHLNQAPEISWTQISPAASIIYKDWTYLAIYHCFESENIDCNPEALSVRLQLPIEKVKEVTRHLESFGYLSLTTGQLKAKKQNLASSDGPSSEEIRDSHRQSLNLAQKCLAEMSPTSRDFTSITVTGSSDKFELVKKEIRDFYGRIGLILESGDKRDQVFRINIQAFPFDFRSNQ